MSADQFKLEYASRDLREQQYVEFTQTYLHVNGMALKDQDQL